MSKLSYLVCDALPCKKRFVVDLGLLMFAGGFHACSRECAGQIAKQLWDDMLGEGELDPGRQVEISR